jgi:hypothetical protein
MTGKGGEHRSKRRIFCPPASLFVGHSPLRGWSFRTGTTPHALRAAKISRRAICPHL